MMNTGKLKQILLITDGCSNQGEDPIAMAALAKEQGITVNVIGVMEQDVIDEKGMTEIEGIAMSGGGVSQIVYAQQLSQTVQMVTRKAMTQTIQGVVNRELQQILGRSQTMEDLPPEKSGEVMEVVDELGETVELEVLILVDTSASMKHKLPTVKEALLDLSLSLNARSGDNQFSVFVFPGKKKDVENYWIGHRNLQSLTSIFSQLNNRRNYSDRPGHSYGIISFSQKRSLRSLLSSDDESYFEESM